jgi:hypothetical protein
MSFLLKLNKCSELVAFNNQRRGSSIFMLNRAAEWLQTSLGMITHMSADWQVGRCFPCVQTGEKYAVQNLETLNVTQ